VNSSENSTRSVRNRSNGTPACLQLFCPMGSGAGARRAIWRMSVHLNSTAHTYSTLQTYSTVLSVRLQLFCPSGIGCLSWKGQKVHVS